MSGLKKNKIVVVGEPHSGFERVFDLLCEHGLAPARVSKREGLSPQAIGEMLCQAHQVKPLEAPSARLALAHEASESSTGRALQVEGDDHQGNGGLVQIEPGPVWQGLALDLLMGNLDQPLWGWADPKAIHVLNYWKLLDPTVVFVLVYDAPESILAASLLNGGGQALAGTAGVDETAALLDDWSAYNRTLLEFFYANQSRCLLIQAEDVLRAQPAMLQKMRTQLEAPVTANAPTHEVTDAAIDPYAFLARQIAQGLVPKDHPSLLLFSELQAAGSLPVRRDQAQHNTQLALQAFTRLQESKQEHLRLRDELNPERIRVTGLETNTTTLGKQLAELKAKIAEVQAAPAANQKELEEENELLLAQLHQVEEELERYYLENLELKQSGGKTAKEKPQPLYGAAERIKNQLSYRLGRAMIDRSTSLKGWLSMPWAALRIRSAFRAERRAGAGKALPPVSSYADAYDAERVKQHLSYRIGQHMVRCGMTPWGLIRMLFLVRAEVKRYLAEQGRGHR